MPRAGAVLFDLDGTLTDGVGGQPLAGALDAVRETARLVPVRYLTNATSWPRAALEQSLSREGFVVSPGSVVTPTVLARKVLVQRGHDCGVLIADPRSLEDLEWHRASDPAQARSVLVATEGHDMAIRDLAPAVDALLAGAKLYTLQQNRLFRRRGRLVTDLGPLAAFLAYAAKVDWENLGKPSRLLFQMVAEELGLPLASLMMVGDDAECDAAGALAAGCGAGVLVRTGKYRPGDEDRVQPRPSLVLESVGGVPAALQDLMTSPE